MSKLQEILLNKKREVYEQSQRRSLAELKVMGRDFVSRNFENALSRGSFGLLAEIKRKSPSAGVMREENVESALEIYSRSPLVRAFSILTDSKYFGMSVEELQKARRWQDAHGCRKPLLRKDFIVDLYQIHEAKAFGADAVLLMANVLTEAELKQFAKTAASIGLGVLFESHNLDQIKHLPQGARVCGINSRLLDGGASQFRMSSLLHGVLGSSFLRGDLTTQAKRFNLVKFLPKNCVKVAESGITPDSVKWVSRHFDCGLVGTSLLTNPRGIEVALSEFDEALSPLQLSLPGLVPTHS